MQTLPPSIRHYLGQGKYSVVARSLITKYGLHADQGNILEREIMLLLMGIDTPNEFTQTLVEEAKLDQHVVNGITHDVNEQVFIPLREQMQNEGGNTGRPVRPAAPVTPQPQVNVPPRPQAFAPAPKASSMPPQSVIIQANPSLPQRPAQVAASMMRYTPVPKQPPKPVSPRPSAPFQDQAPSMNTSKMLEDHEEPSPSARMMPSAIPAGLKPPQREYTPPANLPGMMPAAPAMPNIIRRPVTSNTPPPPVPLMPKPPRPPMESYSSDPYREPVDGEGS